MQQNSLMQVLLTTVICLSPACTPKQMTPTQQEKQQKEKLQEQETQSLPAAKKQAKPQANQADKGEDTKPAINTLKAASTPSSETEEEEHTRLKVTPHVCPF